LTCEAAAGREGGLLLELRNNGGLLHASDDVLKIVKTCENVLRSSVDLTHPGQSHKAGVVGLQLEMKVISRLSHHQLFVSNSPHFNDISSGCDGHYFALIRQICKCFLDLRRHHIAHMSNIARQGNIVRQSNNKLTLFRGQ
jgi:hypothetical protein